MLHSPITRRLLTVSLVFLICVGLPIAHGATNEDKLREANSLNERAISLYNGGQYKQALPLLEKALRLRSETLDEKHPDMFQSIINLAQTYAALGRHVDALPHFEKGYQLGIEIFGERHRHTLMSLNNLATTYNVLARYDKALPLNEKVLRLRTETQGEKHPTRSRVSAIWHKHTTTLAAIPKR